MYTIKAFADGKEYTIHNPRVKELIVGNAYYQQGDNVNGQAEFSVYPTHPYYQYVKKLTTDIIFYKDGVEKFAGRVLYDDEDAAGTKKVFVEGELAYFCDSVQRPAVYHNTPVKEYLRSLINNHNSQVDERKQFVLGRVSVTDPNDSLYRYSNWETTRATLKDKLLDRLGGHLVIRKENGIRYLDYLNDDEYYTQNDQRISFGRNLLDYSKNMNASDIVTCVIPLGAKKDESEIEGLEERLTIESVNGGVDYVSDDNAVATYGRIYKTVTWDDVTVPENLLRKGREYLSSVQYENMVLEVKAIDLNLKDASMQEFKVGDLIRCVSPPNGLDTRMPLSSIKIYISNFAKNTITLGTEKSNATYTSSNAHKTEQMKQVINSIPSKGEILQEALRDATKLLNDMNQTGNAIHTKSEFIVSDTPGVENAKNLWRWGLGGLAHYSQGYDGPVDGVALTMDGKINGRMLMADSVLAESIDIGYRTSVETKISESETAAKDHADGSVRAAKESIENSITNMEQRIALSVSSVKEIVERKNYVSGGEEESLDIGKFTVTGSTDVCKIEKAEFLNMPAIKLTFSAYGNISIRQSLGSLEAGNYTVSVKAAYPEGSHPNYIRYGFYGNTATSYFNQYTADEFHSYSQSVKISKAAKTIEIKVYAYADTVVYLTDIRCLREIQELLDDVNARLDVEVGKVTASVNEVYENNQHDYCQNGSFSDSDDPFASWYRSDAERITKISVESKDWVQMNRVDSTGLYLRQLVKVGKTGPFTVRFKAKCEEGQEQTARISVIFGSSGKYMAAGELAATYKTFEYRFDSVTEGSRYFYIYNYASGTTVYVTDVEILGYYSAYSEAQLSVLSDAVTSSVKKDEFASYVTQYYDRVITAFNNSSKYVQVTAGEISIYDSAIQDSAKRSVFDEAGNHFYRDGYYVGKIGTNQWQKDKSHKGLVMDLEPQGKYMAFAQKASASATSYTTMLCFSRANSIYDDYGMHLGCDMNGEWNTLKNFKVGSLSAGGYTAYTGTIPIVTELSASGSDINWSYSKLRIYNGIIVGYWN